MGRETEREDDLFCIRQWIFFGNRDMRERLGFDYWTFDYGTVDGREVLFDANRAPKVAHSKNRTANTARIVNSAEGILSSGRP